MSVFMKIRYWTGYHTQNLNGNSVLSEKLYMVCYLTDQGITLGFIPAKTKGVTHLM